MTKYLYQARVVPIGRPATVRGDQGQPVTFTFDQFHFSDSRTRARDIPVCLGHDHEMRIGNLRSLTPNREWWVCCFELNDVLGIEFDVGQNVSIGLKWFVNYISTPRVEEISVVRRGRIPGAEITARVLAPTPAPAPAVARVPAREPAGEVIYGGAIIRRNIGQVTAVGGVALRTGDPIRYHGDDIVVARADGSEVIYCGAEGRLEAIRDGVLRRVA